MLKTTTTTCQAMTKTIGTHSGTFHCDEALGVALLRTTRLFANASVTRARDEATLSALDCVIDVGGEYDHDRLRYDHHQRGFTEVFGVGGFNTVKLSSAGLVYRHYGREVISSETGLAIDDPSTETLYLEMYKHFIEGVDAIDNGVEQFRPVKRRRHKRKMDDEGAEILDVLLGEEEEEDVALEKVYLEETGLASRVGALNPAWNEETSDAILDAKFEVASEMAGKEFLAKLTYLHKSWLPARDIVKQAMAQRFEVDKSGRILVLSRYCPWKDHLFDLEGEEAEANKGGNPPTDPAPPAAPGGEAQPAEHGNYNRALYCLYEDERSKKWRIQSVPEAGVGAFSQRKPLPANWRGMRGVGLDAVTGVPGGTFVHAAGFTGGHDTYEGILKLAKMAITDTCCCCS